MVGAGAGRVGCTPGVNGVNGVKLWAKCYTIYTINTLCKTLGHHLHLRVSVNGVNGLKVTPKFYTIYTRVQGLSSN